MCRRDLSRYSSDLVTLLGITLTASTGFAQPPAADAPPARSMRVNVLQPDGKPAAGAKLYASIWTKEPFKANRGYVCDAAGQVTVELPRSIDILRLWASYPGHVGLFTQLTPDGNERARPIPLEFNFRLEKGTTIGGVVKDSDGSPIAGVKVQLMLDSLNGDKEARDHPIPTNWLAEGDTAIYTDAQGRWILNTMPADEACDVLVMLNHPHYVSDNDWGGLQEQQGLTVNDFRAQTSTFVMSRGTVVSGRVVDPNGKPVSGAVVVWGKDPYLQHGSQERQTDDKGMYQLPPFAPGTHLVTAIAKGWAPEQQEVTLTADKTTIDFALRPGKRLRMLFVDEDGIAIPSADVMIVRWRGNNALYNHKHSEVLDTQVPHKADAQGLFEWTWAPENEVVYCCGKLGFKDIDELRLTAQDDQEYVITLLKKK